MNVKLLIAIFILVLLEMFIGHVTTGSTAMLSDAQASELGALAGIGYTNTTSGVGSIASQATLLGAFVRLLTVQYSWTTGNYEIVKYFLMLIHAAYFLFILYTIRQTFWGS